jgi:hypothetical protein
MKNRVSYDLIWGLLSALLIFGVFILTLWGNSNNLDPRYLFIDEQITFYPVAKILNPSGLDEFLWLISDGADYRYGRILWNAIAFAALIPAKLGGEAGQIIAGREVGAVFLLSSYLILTKTFIQNSALRFAALLTLITLPYNSYYMSMPKPEPIMLLCASLFLLFYRKSNFKFGQAYWIFLGMAFGAKISFLLPLLTLLGASLYFSIYKEKKLPSISDITNTIGYIVIGFVIANPFFMPALLAVLFSLLMLLLISRLSNIPYYIVVFIAITLLTIASSLPIFRGVLIDDLLDLSGSRHAFGEWIRGTFLKINDGSPVNDQTFLSWFKYLGQIAIPNFPYIGGAFFLGIGILLASQIYNLRKVNSEHYSFAFLTLLIMCIGFMLLLSPMVGVKNRLWGMYLFPGMIFTILALFSAVDQNITIKNSGSIFSKFITLCLFFIAIFTTFFSWAPRFLKDLIELATRNPLNPHSPLSIWLLGV